MPEITLITGGIKSGKSRKALEIAGTFSGSKLFIATAECLDSEMKQRITRHQEERGHDFVTLEAPLDIVGDAQKYSGFNPKVIVLDCLTLWVNNLLHHLSDEKKIQTAIESFMRWVSSVEVPLIIVTNEVGMGVIPDNPLTRRYLDLLGYVNRQVADLANSVVLMVSGQPVIAKGVLSNEKLGTTINKY